MELSFGRGSQVDLHQALPLFLLRCDADSTRVAYERETEHERLRGALQETTESASHGEEDARKIEALQEQLADVETEDEAARFDLSFSLMSLEFRRLIPRLLQLFGGLVPEHGK